MSINGLYAVINGRVGGVLSRLEIDTDKDWASFGIDSLGYVIIEDGAGHYFKLPSLTTAQRDALTPATGMTIWNSDNTQVERYNGASWGALGMAGVSVRKDFGAVIGTRPQLNIMTGVGVELMVEDNPPGMINMGSAGLVAIGMPSRAKAQGATGSSWAVMPPGPISKKYSYGEPGLRPHSGSSDT